MRKYDSENGISIIICCYNSSKRLLPTLMAISQQKFETYIPWEVILVDNASTDDTSKVAICIWESFSKNSNVHFSVHYEGIPGLGNARNKGITESKFTFLLFCDDDNWLSPNYVENAYNILSCNPSIAACGGMGIPVFETEKPFWFDYYAEAFAIGEQDLHTENGRLLSLYGAGMAINKNVLFALKNSGFEPQFTGRKGKSLSSAEDTELTYAFVLNGKELYYSKKMIFQHFLPKERLHFAYLKKLFFAFGTDGPLRNLYYAHISNRFFHKLIKNWWCHFLISLMRLFKYLIVPPKKYGREIYFKWNIAYIKQLLNIKEQYNLLNNNILKIKQADADFKTNYITGYKIASV